MNKPPTRSLIALLRGMSASGFFSFCAIRDLTMSTAWTGASDTAATGPELVGEGGTGAAGAEDFGGADGEAALGSPEAGAASSSTTGSTS